ncbi:MAG: ArsR/SmtB family transcription factor [Janthinobacterium lividum]
MATTVTRRVRVGQGADPGGRADEVVLVVGARRRHPDQGEDEDAEQHEPQPQVDLPGGGHEQREQRGEGQEADLHAAGAVEHELGRPVRRRATCSARSTTSDQPSPSSRRFDPVMFAAASCTYSGREPAVQAKYRSTAYSGSTAMTTLSEKAGVSIATASQHLTRLRLAGLVRAHRDGRRQISTVEDPHVLTLVHQSFDHIGPDGTPAPDPEFPLADPRRGAADLTSGRPPG